MLLKYRLGHDTGAAVSMKEMAFPRAFPKPFILPEQFFPLASFSKVSPRALTFSSSYPPTRRARASGVKVCLLDFQTPCPWHQSGERSQGPFSAKGKY